MILRDNQQSNRGKKYLVVGYLFYGIAAIFSATRNIAAVVGGRILDVITSSAELNWSGDSLVYYQDPLGFWFMDFVVEESLELWGGQFYSGGIHRLFNTAY